MKTSQDWWDEVRDDSGRFLDWLHKQYQGEATAAIRLRQFLDCFGAEAEDPRWVETITEIARQEELHAEWVGALLRARGEEPRIVENQPSRYWESTTDGIADWNTGCVVAAHAEKMRLERIRVIASDPLAPTDVREVFIKILPQEEFHERAFRAFSTGEALLRTVGNHARGAMALGLVP